MDRINNRLRRLTPNPSRPIHTFNTEAICENNWGQDSAIQRKNARFHALLAALRRPKSRLDLN